MLDWLKINSLKTNPGKFQFIVLGVKNVTPFRLNVNGKIIACSNAVKLLEKLLIMNLNLQKQPPEVFYDKKCS